MKVFDCTLRDGANVLGYGFNAKQTTMMIEGLIDCGIYDIEMGNALGLGAYEANNAIAPLTDIEYLELVAPYLDKAEIGMFAGWRNINQANVDLAVKYGLKFLRIGANASEGAMAADAVKLVKAAGLKCRFAMMKGYVLSAEELADEAKMLQDCGLDEITIMDSAGTMMPDQVEQYVAALVSKLDIPVGFHGHNNLGLSVANAIAARRGGAFSFDSGLIGMARSAGNCATELLVAAFQREGFLDEVDLYKLLAFLDAELIPEMEQHGYHTAVKPVDLIYGLAGCHSSFAKMFEQIAEEKQVPLYKLIVEVSKLDQKAPSRELVCEVAGKL